MDRNREIISAQCRNLSGEYGQLLEALLAEEIAKVRVHASGNTEFELPKSSLVNQGIEEGLKRFIAAINRHAKDRTEAQ